MKRDKTLKIINLMVDGFGVPPSGWKSSVFAEFAAPEFISLFENNSKPIDACLGIEGLPQSATGQCSFFSGVNAQAIMGRHIPGFPGPALREIIQRKNIFRSLMDIGKSVSFANAYVKFNLPQLEAAGMQSVTSVMTASTLGSTLGLEDLKKSEALYHDLTRKSLEAEYGAGIITPSLAAENLVGIAREHELTLFEYFLTDRAGHKGDIDTLGTVIKEFSEFLCTLAESLQENMLLVMSSDHGNCEDPLTKQHTRNPVPFLLTGRRIPDSKSVNAISDIHDYLINCLKTQ